MCIAIFSEYTDCGRISRGLHQGFEFFNKWDVPPCEDTKSRNDHNKWSFEGNHQAGTKEAEYYFSPLRCAIMSSKDFSSVFSSFKFFS